MTNYTHRSDNEFLDDAKKGLVKLSNYNNFLSKHKITKKKSDN